MNLIQLICEEANILQKKKKETLGFYGRGICIYKKEDALAQKKMSERKKEKEN